MSADGRWIAYTTFVLTRQDQPGGFSETSQISLYDQQTGVLLPPLSEFDENNSPIVESLDPAGHAPSVGSGRSVSPSISADGNYIAFVRVLDDLVDLETLTCKTPEGDCAEIYVYNRITRTYNRFQIDGVITSLVISPDGRWVAFWSTANNLVPGDVEVCRQGDQIYSCLDIFLYEWQSGTMERIPIGRSLEQQRLNEPLSLSADGSLVAVTLHSSDRVAQRLNMTNDKDVYIIDWRKDKFEPANQTEDGTPGDHPSTLPTLSADGRFVAFATRATNLAAGDINGKKDVYLKDLKTGEIEWVSQTNDETSGNGDSGQVSRDFLTGMGERISLSSDGRFVAFSSSAGNLTTGEPNGCVGFGLDPCINIFVRDRQRGTTMPVTNEAPRMGIALLPAISEGGRWLAFTYMFVNCSSLEVCSEVWLYDLWTGSGKTVSSVKFVTGDDPSNWTYQRLTGHRGAVNSVDFSPNRNLLATGSNDHLVRLFRVSDGALLYTLEGHTRPVTSLAFSPDGALLATTSRDGTVNLWRTSDGSLVTQLAESSKEIYSLAFSPDGKRLAAGGIAAIWIWQKTPQGFSFADRMEYPQGFVNSLTFSPDGSLLALGLSDNTVWLLDQAENRENLRLGGHTKKVLRVVFTPDGQYLSSAAADNSVNLWRLNKDGDGALRAELVFTLQHLDWVKSLAFSPDGSTLATASLDGGVRLWRIPEGELLETYLRDYREPLLSLAFSPDGRTLAAGSVRSAARLWRISK